MPRRYAIISLLLSSAVAFFFCPASLAQELPEVWFPCTYSGTVTTMDGLPVPDGTQVYAIVDGWNSKDDGQWTQVSQGKYRLSVRPPSRTYFGKTVTFYVGDQQANETAIFPNTHDPDAERWPTLDLTVPGAVIPPEVGDTTLPWLRLAILCLGAFMLLSGAFVLKRRAYA
ncbi:MAG TPA: hypothetical protein G4O03_03570 [Dehalococcoidia bacterium]|jgi:hypothetical protein|nr:hypothetical protein [Dehalococcoidia bacterium]